MPVPREHDARLVLIHEYYSHFDRNAVFITVDMTLCSNQLDIWAYVRSKVGLPNKTEGPVPCNIMYFELERVGWACARFVEGW